MNELWNKFNQYQRSEQIAILTLGVVLVVFFLWALVVNPIEKRHNQLQQVNLATTASLARVQTMVAKIQQEGASSNQSGGENINSLIDSTLRESGLMMSSFQPGANGEVRLRLDRANYLPLIEWVYVMETQHGVSVKDLVLAGIDDPGLVNATVRLQKAE